MFVTIDRRLIRNIDLAFLVPAMILLLLGILNLRSAGGASGAWKYQLAWFMMGLVAMLLVMTIDYHRWQSLAVFFYLGCIGLLVAVLYLGPVIHHSRAWLVFQGFQLQPSEPTKLAVVMMLARIYQKREDRKSMGVLSIIYPLTIIMVPTALIVLEPDMGTALIFLLFGAALLLFMGINRWLLIAFAVLAIASAPLGWKYVLKPHQRSRIITFLEPGKDPLGKGYNILQSKVAIGSGSFFGKGWKRGTQNMLRFLPEQHTDFSFSVWAEEWGFLLGVFPVLILYLLILSRGISIAGMAKDRLGVMLALGAVMIIFSHFLVNLAMISGWFPVIGVPLPFFSYGGSHLVLIFLLLGLVLNVGMRRYVF
jgi:rod shape determining protein RodA